MGWWTWRWKPYFPSSSPSFTLTFLLPRSPPIIPHNIQHPKVLLRRPQMRSTRERRKVMALHANIIPVPHLGIIRRAIIERIIGGQLFFFAFTAPYTNLCRRSSVLENVGNLRRQRDVP